MTAPASPPQDYEQNPQVDRENLMVHVFFCARLLTPPGLALRGADVPQHADCPAPIAQT